MAGWGGEGVKWVGERGVGLGEGGMYQAEENGQDQGQSPGHWPAEIGKWHAISATRDSWL